MKFEEWEFEKNDYLMQKIKNYCTGGIVTGVCVNVCA